MELTIKILLGLVTLSVARPRTVYRFQGDNAEHWLEGAPGESVRGFYSWISPEGSEFYVKYIADQNGYRILDSNAVPVDHSGLAADGNQVITELLNMNMVPLSHDGLVVFDSSKTEPEDQANLDSTNSLPSNNGNNDIAISQDEDDLSEAADKSSIENMESDPIPIDIAELIEEAPKESTQVELNEEEQEEFTQVELMKEELEEPIELDSIPIHISIVIEEVQEESTQLPNTEDIEIIDNMLEASSSFGERTDDVAMVPNAAPIEPIVNPMDIETMQRGGKRRTFTPIRMENGDLTFIEVNPVLIGHEGEASSSVMKACDLCETQNDSDYIDDTLRNV